MGRDLGWHYFKGGYFSTLLPPPNLTGTLHLGHVWNAILQDTLVRCHRKFFRTDKASLCYWAAGVDHAGISLQIRVEEELRKEGKKRADLSSEEFMKRLNGWAKDRREDILRQYAKLGYSFSAEEEVFKYTLSPQSEKFCGEIFKRLCLNGLIYRSKRLVNWDTKLKTAISDAEVDHVPINSKIYTLKYFYSEKEYIPVATTRPETIFGDSALFVHPKDERYAHLIGVEVVVPLTNRKIRVMADEYVDVSFGTGAMKCTPAHDFDDGKLGEKYGLEVIQVFGEDLRVCVEPYEGRIYSDIRGEVVEELRAKGFLEKEEDYQSNVSYSSRSGAIVEPLLSTQWFLRSSQMAYDAWLYWRDHRHEMRVVNPSYRGRLELILKNTEDWCISRQLEWGIKIPAYVGEGDEFSLEPREGFRPCVDVLDTWFSSSLWPFIAMNCGSRNLSEKYGNMPTFPISALISGKDILLFWIAKMVFMCYFLEGQLPFQNIFLHGLVLDSQRRKMSKSLNNGVDPLQLIGDKLDENRVISHDAVRLFFLSSTHDANNIVFSRDKLKYFCNVLHKFKKAHEFYQREKREYVDGGGVRAMEDYESVFLRELNSAIFELASNLREFNFAKAVDRALFFFRENFCNRYLETYKLFRNGKNQNFLFLRKVWRRMMDMFEILIPDFVGSLELDEEVCEEIEVERCVSVSGLSWWFKYLKMFGDLDNRLKFDGSSPIGITIYVDSVFKYASLNYLELLGQKIKRIGKLEERDISKVRDDVIILTIHSDNDHMVFELELSEQDRGKIVEYRRFMEGEMAWLRKEIAFLNNRIKGFNHLTPKPLRVEVQEKLNRYKEDLRCYELNCGIRTLG